MKKIILSVVVLTALLVMMIGWEKVPIDRVGIIVNNFGGSDRTGIQEGDLPPGMIWVWPIFQELYLLDPTIQQLDLTERDSIQIRDKDQYTTDLDISVMYQIGRDDETGDTKAWKVARATGRSIERFRDFTRAQAVKNIWETMSDMETEDFFDSDKRVEQARIAATALNLSLKEESIEVVDVLVRKVVYDPNFEEKLLDRQLYDQQRTLNEALTVAENAQAATQKIEKDTEALVKKITQEREKEILRIQSETEKAMREIEGDTELYTRRVLSEADAYAKSAVSEGQLAIDKARAEGEMRINAAYAKAGGEFLIAKKMIEGIELGAIQINTNAWNPFDVEQTLEKILGRTIDLKSTAGEDK